MQRSVLSLFLCCTLPLFLFHTPTHARRHTHTCSGGLRVVERLPWVTHSDKVLSLWAILIYVNKPCRCRERQRGHRWALVTSAPSLEGKGADKEQCRRTQKTREVWRKTRILWRRAMINLATQRVVFVAEKSNSLMLAIFCVVCGVFYFCARVRVCTGRAQISSQAVSRDCCR